MIFHLSGVCGTGKTEQLINNIELVKHTETSIILWASLTNKLSEATCNRYKEKYPEHNAMLISSENSLSVRSEILQHIGRPCSLTTQILFISHIALSMLSLDVLQQCTVIIDELPTLIGDYQRLKIPLQDESMLGLTPYIEYEDSLFEGYQRIVIKEEMKLNAKQFAYDLLHNADSNSDSVKAGKLLMGVLHNSKGIFVSTIDNWKLFEFFTGLEFAKKLSQLESVWLLSANLEGLFVEQLLSAYECHINTEHSLSHLNLPLTHPNTSNVEILPFLKNDSTKRSSSFSGYFANSLSCKVIKDSTEEIDVHQLFNQWVISKFENNNFIYCSNKSTTVINHPNSTRLPPMAQGLNNHSHFNQVAFMPHLRPTPEHEAAIKRLASDIGINKQTFVDSYINQTSYEAAYQFSSRISFRNLSRNEDHSLVKEQLQPKCQIIVPDMAHAEYIHNMMPTASINTDGSYERVPSQATEEEITLRQTNKSTRKAIKDAQEQIQKFSILYSIYSLMKDGLTANIACDCFNITARTRRNWLKRYGDDWTNWLTEQEMSLELERETEAS
ncbi:hypothetical protein A6E12_08620 [Aliivibrio fischeri]|uniref:hypothetical protein n=1 Tax=Aliivibrio fischeri TaxID=668 RepID=UPI00080E637D|nr:hypothetical protein [Aliivibrio fischeri]OCH28930.1 hypothetical protein A6E12_08620 [Aliivibrio fischeri]